MDAVAQRGKRPSVHVAAWISRRIHRLRDTGCGTKQTLDLGGCTPVKAREDGGLLLCYLLIVGNPILPTSLLK